MKKTPIEQRFWNKVKKTDDCWIWVGCRGSRGYGQLMFNRKNCKAHRVSYLLAYGPFDETLNVLHMCDNPSCVRPEHLFLGTQRDNYWDMKTKGRMGNFKGEANPRAKLTTQQVLEIRVRYAHGENRAVLSKIFPVNRATIGKIVHYQLWSHIAPALVS